MKSLLGRALTKIKRVEAVKAHTKKSLLQNFLRIFFFWLKILNFDFFKENEEYIFY